jgi:hypothetical protein
MIEETISAHTIRATTIDVKADLIESSGKPLFVSFLIP